MSKTWFCSDHHFGHSNILNFKDKLGKPLRSFGSIDEHDSIIIDNHNKLVKPEDRVYFMGDLAIGKKDIHKVSRMNGRKVLIKGNHDIFKLQDYIDYFDDIRSIKVYPKNGITITHIPVHTSQLEHRFKLNVHGHTHSNLITQEGSQVPDKRYLNVCLEHTNFCPVDFDYILSEFERRDLN